MNLTKKIRKSEEGFTLVELVIVIAILAVLAALLVPRIMGNVAQSRYSAALADARTIAGEVTTQNALELAKDTPEEEKIIKASEGNTLTLTDEILAKADIDTGDKLAKAAAVQITVVVDDEGNASVVDENVEFGGYSSGD